MGDTTSKTLRRHTVERRWCSEECQEGTEVRQALQREAARKAFTLNGTATGRLSSKKAGPFRMLPLPHANTNDSKSTPILDRHWIRRGVPAPPIRDTITLSLDYGPIERRVLASMKERK